MNDTKVHVILQNFIGAILYELTDKQNVTPVKVRISTYFLNTDGSQTMTESEQIVDTEKYAIDFIQYQKKKALDEAKNIIEDNL